MSKKLMPYAIFSLLYEFFISSDGNGSSGFFMFISIILVTVSLASDLYSLYNNLKSN